VLTNSNHPDFISELIRSVALNYEWNDYVPVYKKTEVQSYLITEISGRYQVNSDRFIEIYQKDDQLLFKNILAEEPVELIKISDSTYVTRDDSRLYKFALDSESEIINMITFNSNDGKILSTFTKMDHSTKIPLQFLLEGNFAEAMNAYRALLKQDPKNPALSEDSFNNMGYDLLSRTKTKLAQDIFKVNMMLYPNSFNVYDSYTEACMKMSEIDLAIKNYTKSISLNP